MKKLYELAIGKNQGEYDVVECNCHHMAQCAFNFCAVDGAHHVRNFPNNFHRRVAGVLRAGASMLPLQAAHRATMPPPLPAHPASPPGLPCLTRLAV